MPMPSELPKKAAKSMKKAAKSMKKPAKSMSYSHQKFSKV
jgi:hypothetical protein